MLKLNVFFSKNSALKCVHFSYLPRSSDIVESAGRYGRCWCHWTAWQGSWRWTEQRVCSAWVIKCSAWDKLYRFLLFHIFRLALMNHCQDFRFSGLRIRCDGTESFWADTYDRFKEIWWIWAKGLIPLQVYSSTIHPFKMSHSWWLSHSLSFLFRFWFLLFLAL